MQAAAVRIGRIDVTGMNPSPGPSPAKLERGASILVTVLGVGTPLRCRWGGAGGGVQATPLASPYPLRRFARASQKRQ